MDIYLQLCINDVNRPKCGSYEFIWHGPRMRAAVARIIALNGFTCRDGINARLRRFRAYVGRVALYSAMRSGGMQLD